MDPKSIGICIFGNILGVIGIITLNDLFIIVAIVASLSTIVYNSVKTVTEVQLHKKVKKKLKKDAPKERLPSDNQG